MITAFLAALRARIGRRVICASCRCRVHDLTVHRYIDHGDEA